MRLPEGKTRSLDVERLRKTPEAFVTRRVSVVTRCALDRHMDFSSQEAVEILILVAFPTDLPY